jgi:hypothetical protein
MLSWLSPSNPKDSKCRPGPYNFVFRLYNVNKRLRGAGLRSELTCLQQERHTLGVAGIVRRVAELIAHQTG